MIKWKSSIYPRDVSSLAVQMHLLRCGDNLLGVSCTSFVAERTILFPIARIFWVRRTCNWSAQSFAVEGLNCAYAVGASILLGIWSCTCFFKAVLLLYKRVLKRLHNTRNCTLPYPTRGLEMKYCCSVRYCSVLCCAVLCCTALYCAVLCCTALLYCAVLLCCTVLYCTVLYCTALSDACHNRSTGRAVESLCLEIEGIFICNIDVQTAP